MEASGQEDAVSSFWVRYRAESGLGEGACILIQEQREKRLKRVYKFNLVPLNTLILVTLQLLVHGLEIFVHITEELLHTAFQIEYISVSFSGLEADGIPLLENIGPLSSPWLAFLFHSIIILHCPRDMYWWVETGRKLQRAFLMIQPWSNLTAV